MEQIGLSSGRLRAVFRREERGWAADWFYEGAVPLLRFKDHEWLSLGRVVCVTHAAQAERAGSGWRFMGVERVAECAVRWEVEVESAGEGFFRSNRSRPRDYGAAGMREGKGCREKCAETACTR